MEYRFILTYTPTDSETTVTRTCFPLHSDDLAISIDREQDEWFYTRKLDGKMVFERDDYAWIMDRDFDGTFTLDVKQSIDGGANWYDYFKSTFSRASLDIDEDNRTATLNGLSESVYETIKNGKNEDYDLMKIIPDSEAKEVQGQVPPALALVDDRSYTVDQSNMFCGMPITAGGYNYSKYPNLANKWGLTNNMNNGTAPWLYMGVYAEAKVTMTNRSSSLNGLFSGSPDYGPHTFNHYTVTSVYGDLTSQNSTNILRIIVRKAADGLHAGIYLYDSNMNILGSEDQLLGADTTGYYSPNSFSFSNITPGTGVTDSFEKIEIIFHYIYAALLTQVKFLGTNFLDTGDYYKGIETFNNDGGLQVTITANTSDQPNGHRMVPGTDEYGGIPQYFAPPDTTHDWIPLAEDNWNFASMWYTIEPSPANGLTDPDKCGSFTWTRCWTIGTCIKYLLQKITNNEVNFAETTNYSQFLYGYPNPVADHEPFQWLVTQKSNVMSPAATGAARCPVRLDWFLELLRNAFNCYYYLIRLNDGTYEFHIEHVEYFRRGGTYDQNAQISIQSDLTRLKPMRNFLRNGQPAKRYADQTNKYTFDLDNMAEKYTFSWQGDGGGDDFKGNPMFFKAGWVVKGQSEDHQVDNIFADLGWLMLNAGTDTASSKNYDGLFIFGGYNAVATEQWRENTPALSQTITISVVFFATIDLYLTIPSGYTISINTGQTMRTVTGTGAMQHVSVVRNFISINPVVIDFGNNYNSVIVHRIRTRSGNVYRVPHVENKLRDNTYLQNGVLAWPWLQNEYLHYDIPAAKWAYTADMLSEVQPGDWQDDGTIKMVKKQTVGVVPFPNNDPDTSQGVKTGLGIGIIDSAKINLSSRNAELTLIYDINPSNNQ